MSLDRIDVPSESNVAAVELLLDRLSKSDFAETLRLATNLKGWEFGGRAAMMQFIATWAGSSPTCRLQTYAQNCQGFNAQLQNFVDSDHGLIATLFAKQIYLIDNTDVTVQAKAMAASRIAHMQNTIQHENLGMRIFLVCQDSVRKNAFVGPLYTLRHGANAQYAAIPLPEWEMLEVTAKILSTVSPSSRLSIKDANAESINSILWELFQNTHDWGREEPGRGLVKNSIRLVSVEGFRADETAMKKASKDLRLHEYFKTVNQRTGRPTFFVQISVMDTGVGLARHWNRGRTLEGALPGIEYEMVLQCLTKGHSTSFLSNKGYGLHRVLRILTSSGAYLRLRTGRLHLFRDLLTNPYLEDAEPLLNDWLSGRTNNPEHIAPVCGTLFTMMLPLNDLVS